MNRKGGIIAFFGGNILMAMTLALVAVAGHGADLIVALNMQSALSLVFIFILEAILILAPDDVFLK